MLDLSATTTMLQSSEEDVLMSNDGHAHTENGNLHNGFMDPRVLNIDDMDLPDSTEPLSREKSETMSDITKVAAIPRSSFLPTGCCYDDRMKLHANADFSENPHHPEDPRRIEAIMTEFKEAGLIFTGTTIELAELQKTSPNQWMWRIAARKATEQEICTAHTASHYAWVKSLSQMSSARLRELTNEFDNGRKSIYVGNLTYQAALISAGGAIESCKNVVVGRVKNAIAVIRPPGHHAEHNESLGFCIFNNVPIAAKVCMADYPELCRKVLILDWDVHHGNGIQNIFYDDPNVLYISLHVYANGTFYPGVPDEPGLPDGGLDMCGAGVGAGKNINIGWTEQGMGDGEYMAAFQKIIMPIAHEFDPDLVIVSAGFDAAAGDELGGCFVSPACYSHMTHMLMSLANGKVAVCLEGGYNLRAISKSALAVAKTLMGEPPERMTLPPLNREAAMTIDTVQRIQSRYWNCMRTSIVPYAELKERGAERVSDVIRLAQKETLSRKHGMTALYIMRNKLVLTYENQVLATPGLQAAKKILLIVHDPPDLQAQADIDGNGPLPHNAFVTDGVMPYIDWAISTGFGVIDVNIPHSLADPTDAEPHLPKSSETELQQQTKELLCYLWDNYLENSRASVTLMGVGDAYLGIKQLLISREARSRIPGIISFVAGNLRPVKSETDQGLSIWYKQYSQIYVSPEHACWSDEESARKVRRNRFGKVVKADVEVGRGENGVGKMLKHYEADASAWMLEKVTEWEEMNLADPDATEEDEAEEAPGRGKWKGEEDEKRKSTVARSGPDVEMSGLLGGDLSRKPQIQQSIRVPVGMASMT